MSTKGVINTRSANNQERPAVGPNSQSAVAKSNKTLCSVLSTQLNYQVDFGNESAIIRLISGYAAENGHKNQIRL